jgi:hypothetical protein
MARGARAARINLARPILFYPREQKNMTKARNSRRPKPAAKQKPVETLEPMESLVSQQNQNPLPDASFPISDEAPAPDSGEGLRVVEVEALNDAPQVVEPDAPAQSAPVAVVVMTKEEFWLFFSSSFMLAGNAAAAIPPLHAPMRSLVNAPHHEQARPASDEIYDLAQRYEWLRWLIQPETQDLRAVAIIGSFAFGVGTAVRNELAQRARNVAMIERRHQGSIHADEADPPAVPGEGGGEVDGQEIAQ